MPNKEIISQEELDARWAKKREQIELLSNSIRSFRNNVTRDLQAKDERIWLTALAVDLMDKTAERVGNSQSARNGHYGITGLKKSHISTDGNRITLTYTGKSGVDHVKVFSDERLAKNLRRAIKNSPNKYLFCTSDRFRIKADKVNRFMEEFGLRSKDIRGYSANRLMINKLKKAEPFETEKERQRYFNTSAKIVAKKIGHGVATLKNQYLLPELEIEYVENNHIVDMDNATKYAQGGVVKEEEKQSPDIDSLIAKYYENNLGIDLDSDEDFYSEIVKSINKTNDFLKTKEDKILYRIIDAKDVDYEKLGLHYVTDIKDITQGFIASIGLNIKRDNFRVLKVKVPYIDIDVDGAFFHNVNYPSEFEITLKTDKNVKVIDEYKISDLVGFTYEEGGVVTNTANTNIFSGEEIKKIFSKLKNRDGNDYEEFAEQNISPDAIYILNEFAIDDLLKRNEDVADYVKSELSNYKAGRKIKTPILIGDSEMNGSYGVTDGYGRITQALANKEKTIAAYVDVSELVDLAAEYLEEHPTYNTPEEDSGWENDCAIVSSRFISYLKENKEDVSGEYTLIAGVEKSGGHAMHHVAVLHIPSDMIIDLTYGQFEEGVQYRIYSKKEFEEKFNTENFDFDGYRKNYSRMEENPFEQSVEYCNRVSEKFLKGGNVYRSIGIEGNLVGKSRNPYIGKEEELKCVQNIRCFYSDVSYRFLYVVGTKNVSVLQFDKDGNTLEEQKKSDKWVLMNAYTKPAYRRMGYGDKLYKEAQKKLDKIIFSKNLSADGDGFKLAMYKKYHEKGGVVSKGVDVIGRDIPNWDNALVYHSTTKEFADDISKRGYRFIPNSKEQSGYYGKAISFTPQADYTKQFGDYTTVARVKEGAKILNLNDEKDWDAYIKITKGRANLNELRDLILKSGYDGLYDVGAGDLFIYNPKVVAFVKIMPNQNFGKGGAVDELTAPNGKPLLLAPNGQPSNLSAEQYALVRTPEFKAWFGDWEKSPKKSSKALDSNGEPLVLYHGSPSVFDIFNFDNIGKQGTTEGHGFYFTPNKDIAEGYSLRRGQGRLFSVFLDIKNPFSNEKRTITKPQIRNILLELHKKDGEYALSNYGDIPHDGLNKTLDAATDVEHSGCDSDTNFIGSLINGGVGTVENVLEAVYKVTGKNGAITSWKGEDFETAIYVVTNPTQIKLADGTNRTFDSKNPDVRFEKGGNVKEQFKLGGLFHGSNKRFDKFSLDNIGDGVEYEDGGQVAHGSHSSLREEAKKYESADKFVAAQPILYHGSKTKIKSLNNKTGMFFTDDMMNADGYAGGENIYEGYLVLNKPFIIDAKGRKWDDLKTEYGKSTQEVVANVDATKYDGVIFKNVKDSWIDDVDYQDSATIYYSFKPKTAFINEDQLIDIWKKANKVEEFKEGGRIYNGLRVPATIETQSVGEGDKREIYDRWNNLVNMSVSQLAKFYASEEGKEAGLTKGKAKELGIRSGRESAKWIMKMKGLDYKEWTPTMWEWANRQISFISRMRGNRGSLYDDKGEKTRKHTSLLIWGHNPEKYASGGKIKRGRGNCFQVAASLLINNDWQREPIMFIGTPYVVHAEVSGQGKLEGIRFAHGWVEDDVLVYDNSNGNSIIALKQRYYEVGKVKTKNPKKYRRYNLEQLSEKLLSSNNYGHWDLDCKYEQGGAVGAEFQYGGDVKAIKNFEPFTPENIEKQMLSIDLVNIAEKHHIGLGVIEKQFAKGLEVEKEHTDNLLIAAEIAKDHLFELPDYYDRLEKMERVSDSAKVEKMKDGECYKNVQDYLLENKLPAAVIVHGEVTNRSGKTMKHAWIENDGNIIDVTTGVRVPKTKYFEILSPKEYSRYTFPEALKMRFKTGNYGAWTKEEEKRVLGDKFVELKSKKMGNGGSVDVDVESENSVVIWKKASHSPYGVDRAIAGYLKYGRSDEFQKDCEIVWGNPNYNTNEKFLAGLDEFIEEGNGKVSKIQSDMVEWIIKGGEDMKKRQYYQAQQERLVGWKYLIETAQTIKDLFKPEKEITIKKALEYMIALLKEVETDEYKKLVSKIAVSQRIDGENRHEIKTTKEIAEILGVKTSQAFDIMTKIEKQGNAFRYGYRTKSGWEDADNSGLKTHSLGWQLSSAIEAEGEQNDAEFKDGGAIRKLSGADKKEAKTWDDIENDSRVKSAWIESFMNKDEYTTYWFELKVGWQLENEGRHICMAETVADACWKLNNLVTKYENDIQQRKKMEDGGSVEGFEKGGGVKFVTDKDKYSKEWGRMGNRYDMKCIGSFDIKQWKNSVGYLYEFNDFDKQFYAHIQLKGNEMLFRYETDTTKIGGMMPVVKINIERGLIYFLKDLYATDDKNLVFDTVGVKAQYLSLHEDVYRSLAKQPNYVMKDKFEGGGEIGNNPYSVGEAIDVDFFGVYQPAKVIHISQDGYVRFEVDLGGKGQHHYTDKKIRKHGVLLAGALIYIENPSLPFFRRGVYRLLSDVAPDGRFDAFDFEDKHKKTAVNKIEIRLATIEEISEDKYAKRMSEKFKDGGLLVGNSHAEGGIPMVVEGSGQHVEVEGKEFVVCDRAFKEDTILEMEGTRAEIAAELNKMYRCNTGVADSLKSGQYILCKKAMADEEVLNLKGTAKEIVTQVAESVNCNGYYEDGGALMAQGGYVSQVRHTIHDIAKMHKVSDEHIKEQFILATKLEQEENLLKKQDTIKRNLIENKNYYFNKSGKSPVDESIKTTLCISYLKALEAVIAKDGGGSKENSTPQDEKIRKAIELIEHQLPVKLGEAGILTIKYLYAEGDGHIFTMKSRSEYPVNRATPKLIRSGFFVNRVGVKGERQLKVPDKIIDNLMLKM